MLFLLGRRFTPRPWPPPEVARSISSDHSPTSVFLGSARSSFNVAKHYPVAVYHPEPILMWGAKEVTMM